ncbi:MAG: hypothetical protein MJK18_00495 [Bdellovibrionales bacterium]|nr:hypothetical protein [Bdellovibrionales bacterium]
MFKCLLIIFATLFSVNSWAQYEDYESYQTFSDLDEYQRDYGLVFMPAATFFQVDENNSVSGQNVNNRKREIFLYDLKLYYIFRGGFTFGLLYGNERQVVNSNAPKTERTNIGLTFGYVRWGWTALATYLPYSIQTLEGTADISEYSKGTGVQVDLAYHLRLSRWFSVGPMMSYRYINYDQAENATTSVNANASSTHSEFIPFISLMFNIHRG